MDALTRAIGDVDRSHALAKATVSQAVHDMLAEANGGGVLTQRSDYSKASEQYQHFRGWVYACVRAIAQTIAGQEIYVGRSKRTMRTVRAKSGRPEGVEPIEDHEILGLLSDPNDLMVAGSLMFTTVASLELTGRQLWWTPMQDQCRRVFPIPTSWIVGADGSTKYSQWRIRPPNHAGEPLKLPAEETVYFHYPSPADPHGVISPLMAAASAVDADESITASQYTMFHRGIHASHAIILGKGRDEEGRPTHMRPSLSGPQRRQIINSVREFYSGVCNQGDPLILDALIEDVKRLSNSPQEMDWLASSQQTKQRITQVFGVNPIILGELEGANRASAVAAESHFWQFTVNPKITLLSQCLTEYLAPQYQSDGQKLVVWIEPGKAHDAELETRRYTLAAQHQAVTVNELRHWLGLPEIDWGEVPVSGLVSGAAVDHTERNAQLDALASLASHPINGARSARVSRMR